MANRAVKLKSGRTLGQALIDKLGSEAERGYVLSDARSLILREGRPARGEPGGESPRLASRIPEPVYRAAKMRATTEGLTLSQVIRALLAGYAAGHSSREKIERVVSDPRRTSVDARRRKKASL